MDGAGIGSSRSGPEGWSGEAGQSGKRSAPLAVLEAILLPIQSDISSCALPCSSGLRPLAFDSIDSGAPREGGAGAERRYSELTHYLRVGGQTSRVPGALPPAIFLCPCRPVDGKGDVPFAILRLASPPEFLPITGSGKGQNDSKYGKSSVISFQSSVRKTARGRALADN